MSGKITWHFAKLTGEDADGLVVKAYIRSRVSMLGPVDYGEGTDSRPGVPLETYDHLSDYADTDLDLVVDLVGKLDTIIADGFQEARERLRGKLAGSDALRGETAAEMRAELRELKQGAASDAEQR